MPVQRLPIGHHYILYTWIWLQTVKPLN